MQRSVVSALFVHVHALFVHVASVSPPVLHSEFDVHLAKEEKNNQFLKASSIHNGRNFLNLFQISIVLNTTALSGSSKQEAWRIRKNMGCKGRLYFNIEGIASICFKSQLCWILQTTDPGVSKDSESYGDFHNAHLLVDQLPKIE